MTNNLKTNIMKLKTVKKHFENAKEVKCLADGQVLNILNPNRNIHIYDCDFWLTTKDGTDVKLTSYDKFAEIISYKDTYTVSKDFILEAHKEACSTWKGKIENEFKELFSKEPIELTLEQIADKFGVEVEQIKIKK